MIDYYCNMKLQLKITIKSNGKSQIINFEENRMPNVGIMLGKFRTDIIKAYISDNDETSSRSLLYREREYFIEDLMKINRGASFPVTVIYDGTEVLKIV